jgi:hypothetical protein
MVFSIFQEISYVSFLHFKILLENTTFYSFTLPYSYFISYPHPISYPPSSLPNFLPFLPFTLTPYPYIPCIFTLTPILSLFLEHIPYPYSIPNPHSIPYPYRPYPFPFYPYFVTNMLLSHYLILLPTSIL